MRRSKKGWFEYGKSDPEGPSSPAAKKSWSVRMWSSFKDFRRGLYYSASTSKRTTPMKIDERSSTSSSSTAAAAASAASASRQQQQEHARGDNDSRIIRRTSVDEESGGGVLVAPFATRRTRKKPRPYAFHSSRASSLFRRQCLTGI